MYHLTGAKFLQLLLLLSREDTAPEGSFPLGTWLMASAASVTNLRAARVHPRDTVPFASQIENYFAH